jgi:hypothetical protein
MAYEKLKEPETFGAERGEEWLAWASNVRQGIEQCRQSVNRTRRALVRCWQEIVDYLVAGFLAR